MSPRKVYGILSSPPTLRIIVSLYEHDLDFDFVPVNVEAGEHQKEPFLSLNPFGEVPAFQDGDLSMFESRAVMRYVAFAYPQPGKEHIFKDPLIQGVVATWIDVEDHQFDPPASKLIDELVFKPEKGLTSNEHVVVKEAASLAEVLDVYEERLSQTKYLGGDKFTSPDLSHLPYLHYLREAEPVKQLFQSRPHVDSWCSSILSRKAWIQTANMIQN